MQRDKMECRKPQLKSKSGPALCRQNLTEKDTRRSLSAIGSCWDMGAIRREGSTRSWDPLCPVCSDSPPREFALLCSHPNCHIFNLLLAPTSKREADPLMLNFSFQSKFHSTFSPRAAGSCLVAGDADGSASPAAAANTEESRAG